MQKKIHFFEGVIGDSEMAKRKKAVFLQKDLKKTEMYSMMKKEKY